MMTDQTIHSGERKTWIAPEIRELDVRETSLSPGIGNDVGGNPSPDCQRSGPLPAQAGAFDRVPAL